MDIKGLSRIDAFPFSHRVGEVMGTPAVTAAPGLPLAEAAKLLIARRVSSLLVGDEAGRPAGIVTERDMLRAMAEHGDAALGRPISTFMSSPVHTVAADVFIYVALARMERLKIRHLAVVDGHGRLVGALSARSLLKVRGSGGLALGDRIAAADTVHDLAGAIRELPTMARGLLAEGLAARAIVAVIAGVMRDATARAAELAEAALKAEGGGAAPASYAVLVLGSAGRGESLLAPDQDNALVHGAETDNPWFAAFGRQLADLLNGAGIPYCKGGVMASETAWRRSLPQWQTTVDGWVAKSRPEDLLNVDIFYDFVPVHGDRALAAQLRSHAMERAAGSRGFLRLLAAQSEDLAPPIGLFGGIRTQAGRADLKAGGLWPLVAGARVIALKRKVEATSTAERLAAARAAGVLGGDDAAALDQAHETILGVLLQQQLIDIEAGRAPTNHVEVGRLSRGERKGLKDALECAGTIRLAVQDVLTAA